MHIYEVYFNIMKYSIVNLCEISVAAETKQAYAYVHTLSSHQQMVGAAQLNNATERNSIVERVQSNLTTPPVHYALDLRLDNGEVGQGDPLPQTGATGRGTEYPVQSAVQVTDQDETTHEGLDWGSVYTNVDLPVEASASDPGSSSMSSQCQRIDPDTSSMSSQCQRIDPDTSSTSLESSTSVKAFMAPSNQLDSVLLPSGQVCPAPLDLAILQEVLSGDDLVVGIILPRYYVL